MIELLVVIIILSALAALALPAYFASTERSRRQEAIAMLSATRESQMRFYALGRVYSLTLGGLDFDPSNTANDPPGSNRHYTYAMGPGPTTAAYTVVATRNAVDGGNGTDTVTINQAGTIT